MSNSKKLHLDWTKKVKDEKEKQKIEETVRGSIRGFELLYQILDEIELDLNTQESNKIDYESPSWAYKQADRNGQRKILKRVKDLLHFVRKD